jgi:hypothetical protein
MKCGICGKEGHNRRSCPEGGDSPSEQSRSHVDLSGQQGREYSLIFRIDGMTAGEMDQMHTRVVKLKRAEVSDSARAALLAGKTADLPSKVRDLIKELEDELKALQARPPAEGN